MEQGPQQYSEYELHHLSSHEHSPAGSISERRGRTVRINSSAAVIPPPSTYSRVHVEDVESTIPEVDSTAADAENLLRAHRSGDVGTSTSNDESFDASEGYTGSTQGGVFYQLLQAYKFPEPESTRSVTPPETALSSGRPGSSGRLTPSRRKWYEQEKASQSQDTLATLVGAAAALANPASKEADSPIRRKQVHKRSSSGNILSKVWKSKEEQDTKIKIHVANILKRQQYIIKMCKAMMLFGAPTHRLEEALAMSAKVLDINSQFLYLPGAMIISFDDPLTHTTEMKIVRVAQGVNLAKLTDTHDIYKEVLHDVIGLDEALTRLDEVIDGKDRHPVWLNVLMYGFASATVSTFFKARLIDMPIIFAMGTLLGLLQLVVAPLSKTYSTVFEITAAIMISFLSRAFGSINGGNLFCFSALTQSGIAMILPGWLVLSSALELQSRAIVPGSIRLVFAIIYSLFLGYGISVGTALYGAIDSSATSASTCTNPLNPYWNFLFVPLYVLCATFTVQAKYRHMPIMVGVALCGYVVNFYATMKFSGSAPIAYTFGAFTVGVLANLYSRFRHGVAAAILLPSVYVQVPGSLASSGSIVAALSTAESIVRGGNESTNSTDNLNALNSISFNFAGGMIQIAIGITVGLFLAALVVYPFGKRRSGLWTL